jgi:anthranilate synthase/aminodeoxychorismate synthase-like glutamine amidotransferase
MILLIDNFDSFVHNLARHFRRLGQPTHVVRNDALSTDAIRTLQPQAIVLSPGPCTPAEAGCSLEVVRTFADTIPMLGVCLGHQTLGAATGGKVIRAAEPMHGRTSRIQHTGKGLFAGLPNPLTVCRYHSLVLETASLPACWNITATTAEGTIMAIEHATRPMFGVQFHPEAVLSEGGYALLANFLRAANLPVAHPLPNGCDERPAASVAQEDWSQVPFTF